MWDSFPSEWTARATRVENEFLHWPLIWTKALAANVALKRNTYLTAFPVWQLSFILVCIYKYAAFCLFKYRKRQQLCPLTCLCSGHESLSGSVISRFYVKLELKVVACKKIVITIAGWHVVVSESHLWCSWHYVILWDIQFTYKHTKASDVAYRNNKPLN